MKPESSGDPLIDLLGRGLGRLMPVDHASGVSEEQYQVLKERNRLLDAISQGLCVVGIVGGGLLPVLVRDHPLEITGWDIGMQFGLGTALPVLLALLVPLLRGKQRLREFLVFYSLKYGMDARKLFLFVYAPIIIFGFFSAHRAYFAGNG